VFDLELAAELLSVTQRLRTTRFVFTTEGELQQGVAQALAVEGLDVEAEVRVDARNRLDLKVGRVGIEIKIGGTWREVRRQLERYAGLDTIGALVLVTSRPSHRRIEGELARKPVFVHLAGSSL
jgi:hypothetical protein